MKKILIAVGMIFCVAAPAMAGDLKISGSVELQYRHGVDNLVTDGNDGFKTEELYIKIEKEVADNISVMIKLDAADLDENDGNTEDVVEEAQVIFKNVLNAPLTIYVGKDEMPWIQDYEKFLFSSEVHGKEVDKVYGVHGQYKIEGFGSLDLAIYERNTLNKNVADVDTSVNESLTARLKANKLVENLSLSVGFMKEGQNDADLAETNDEIGVSIAGKYKWNDLTIHAELVNINKHDGISEEDIIQAGLDYKIGKWLLKGRYETVDNDKATGDDDTFTALGISYYFNKKAYIVIEHEIADPDVGTKTDETMIGLALKY
ncbi:MAG: porin [Proteobacteria bacterium]|nr:porin [Pseudomonadota bacterium]